MRHGEEAHASAVVSVGSVSRYASSCAKRSKPGSACPLLPEESAESRLKFYTCTLKSAALLRRCASCFMLQGGVESYDALSLQVIFRQRALYIVALLRKMTCNLRHPMTLRHPVQCFLYSSLCRVLLLARVAVSSCVCVCACACACVCVRCCLVVSCRFQVAVFKPSPSSLSRHSLFTLSPLSRYSLSFPSSIILFSLIFSFSCAMKSLLFSTLARHFCNPDSAPIPSLGTQPC